MANELNSTSWEANQKHILSKIEDFDNKIDKLANELAEIRKDIAGLNFRQDITTELKEWKDGIVEVISVEEIRRSLKDIDDLKQFKTQVSVTEFEDLKKFKAQIQVQEIEDLKKFKTKISTAVFVIDAVLGIAIAILGLFK